MLAGWLVCDEQLARVVVTIYEILKTRDADENSVLLC